MDREGARFDWWKFGTRAVILVGALLTLTLVSALAFRVLLVNFVDSYEIGYKFDSRTGKIEILQETGYYVTPPFVVSIHTVDLRPMQVCINANARVLNCKLVKFDKAGLETFIAWHGRDDYVGGNSGINGSGTNLTEILKSYAFDGSGRAYPFLIDVTPVRITGDTAVPSP